MNYADAKKITRAMLDADIPALLEGAPGIGKSALVAELARETGRVLYDVRLTSLEPPDLTGLQRILSDGACMYSRPDILPPEDSGPCLLFLDEITAARREMQTVAYQLVYDRKVGSHKLPPDCVIIAAGNRLHDRAITERLSTALASRFAHVTLDADAQSTVQYFLTRGYDARVAGFLNFRPALTHNYRPDAEGHAFACPRTWEMSARLLRNRIESVAEHAAVLGAGVATEFCAFLRLASFADIHKILNQPHAATVHEEHPDQAYAVACAVGASATPENFAQIMCYMLRYRAAEYIVLAADVALSVQADAATRGALMRSRGWLDYVADFRIAGIVG